MTMKPSEGPWRHTTNWLCPGELKGCTVKSGDVEIAHVLSRSVRSQAICDANTRLISAAPDMLAALKKIVFNWDGEPEDMDEAREAISKAEAS